MKQKNSVKISKYIILILFIIILLALCIPSTIRIIQVSQEKSALDKAKNCWTQDVELVNGNYTSMMNYHGHYLMSAIPTVEYYLISSSPEFDIEKHNYIRTQNADNTYTVAKVGKKLESYDDDYLQLKDFYGIYYEISIGINNGTMQYYQIIIEKWIFTYNITDDLWSYQIY